MISQIFFLQRNDLAIMLQVNILNYRAEVDGAASTHVLQIDCLQVEALLPVGHAVARAQIIVHFVKITLLPGHQAILEI